MNPSNHTNINSPVSTNSQAGTQNHPHYSAPNYEALWKETVAENKKMRRLISELTIAIRNETVTTTLLRDWREKARPFLGSLITVQKSHL